MPLQAHKLLIGESTKTETNLQLVGRSFHFWDTQQCIYSTNNGENSIPIHFVPPLVYLGRYMYIEHQSNFAHICSKNIDTK